MLMVVVVLSVPVGVLAAVYWRNLPRNQFTDFMEITNNLAAAVDLRHSRRSGIIQWLFPGSRGFPIVGGTVLSFMTLPTVIIAARAAIGAVPPSYEQAALGMGASRQQAVFQHVLPAALPGIASGVIIGLAQAAGETAPLLMVGMNAFIKDVCEAGAGCLMAKGVGMPSQIYQWAADDDPLFQNKTAAGIVYLLALVISMNAPRPSSARASSNQGNPPSCLKPTSACRPGRQRLLRDTTRSGRLAGVPNRHTAVGLGCGKSTFLRCFNRMNDTIDIARVEGSLLEGEDIYGASTPTRCASVGMVFKPNPFPSRSMTTSPMPAPAAGARTTRAEPYGRGCVRAAACGRSATTGPPA